jgi:transcriptional regulator with XRE-family HTH domain
MIFGIKIKQLRKLYKVTQKEISKLSHISSKRYNKIEKGIVAPTKIEIMKILFTFLEMKENEK